MFVKVRSNLSIKKAKKLIGEVMQDKNVVKNAKYENVDFAAQLKAPEDVNE